MQDELNSISLRQIVTWLFYLVISGAATLVTTNLSQISTSVQELNKHMAIVLYQQGRHEKRLDAYDKRLSELERK